MLRMRMAHQGHAGGGFIGFFQQSFQTPNGPGQKQALYPTRHLRIF
jgi:hypothetical protein